MKRLYAHGLFLFLALTVSSTVVQAQLFDNLRALGGARVPVGDPGLTSTNLLGEAVDGPKDIAVADLDGDGRPDLVASDKDGSLTIGYGVGDGTFEPAVFLHTWTGAPLDLRTLYYTNYYTNIFCNYQPTNPVVTCTTNIQLFSPPSPPISVTNIFCSTNWDWGCVGTLTNVYTNTARVLGPTGLRGLALADLAGSGHPDIAVASPGESVIYLFLNQGGRSFVRTNMPAWFGVRDLAAGDFDGDGKVDLAAAGGTNGVVQYRSLGDGNFAEITRIQALGVDPLGVEDNVDFPQPAFYLKAIRHPGDTRDELIVSHAQFNKVWILRAGDDGALVKVGDLENVQVTALDAAPLLSPATNGAPVDLLTSYSRRGSMEIFAGTNLAQRFSGTSALSFYVPGAPRNVRIADFDLDGWNDLVVVAQNNNKVLTYHNDGGTFSLQSEVIAGAFPREMDLGDFNGDGHLDLAVLNRLSSDASIFLTSSNHGTEVGFLSLDSIYPVDGGVSGLELRDFNQDGRLDVVQLHRASSEFSVRLTQTNGQLAAPIFIPLTNAVYPTAQSTADVNGDNLPDLVTANLSGSVSVRLGLPGGGFGPEETFSLPPGTGGSLFALVPGDFNGDGHIDLAAGFLDCRVSFFRGDGTGKFEFTHTHEFIYEPRSMAAMDLDQDGDLDLVGGSWMDQFVIVENEGDLLSATSLKKVTYGGNTKSGATMKVVDQNGDGDPDLVFGTPDGFTLWLGGPGVTFNKQPTANDPSISGSTFVMADLDGDGDNDIASICPTNSCLSIQTFTNGMFVTVLTVPVPPTRFLAAGDLDGDGYVDLVGSGDILWVALSSRRASNAPPTELPSQREGSRGVVINEVLAQNESLEVAADGGRKTDWVEVYNSTSQPVVMAGWRLMLIHSVPVVTNLGGATVTNTLPVTNNFVFPSDVPLAAQAHRLVVCSDRIRTVYHSGFNLPAEGATLCLFDSLSNEVDRVTYAGQRPDIAYARYTDGARSFVMNTIPSPGAPNVDNGAVDPVLSFGGVDYSSLLIPGSPLRFRATARDDYGIVNVSLLWRRLDVPDTQTKRLILFDDGINEDGPANDGNFLGVLRQAFPPGAEIQFYLECTDLSDQVVTTPGNPEFVTPGQRPRMHTLAVNAPRLPLEISEIVADNESGLTDERGGRPDWVEIRNTSSSTLSLAGVGISPKFFGDGERMGFTNRPSIGPGEHLVIYADGKPVQGALHAPFKLNRAGEQLVLTGTTPNGARYFIDAIVYGPLPRDTALARLGAGGPWVESSPTPRVGNVGTPWRGLVQSNSFIFAWPTQPGRRYTLESQNDLGPTGWLAAPAQTSVGLEMSVSTGMNNRRFYRVRAE